MQFPGMFGRASISARAKWFTWEGYESLKADGKGNSAFEEAEIGSKPQPRRSTMLLGGITALNVLILSATIIISSGIFQVAEKNKALKQTTYYSPILDDLEVPTFIDMMNGTIFPPPNPSIARQEPSPENDIAWEEISIGHITPLIASRDEIIKLGKDPVTVARYDDDYWGFGDNAYMVRMDLFHNLHCLDSLRRAAYATYPGYKPKVDMNGMYWIHLEHCLDMLLQFLKCNGNTDLVTMTWVEGQHSPWTDFNVNRKCRNLDAIIEWEKSRSIDPEKFKQIPRPKGAYVWPNPEKSPTEIGHKLGQHHHHQQQEG